MVVALLCATLVTQIQDPPRVTIEQRALRADVALPKIGAEFGVKLVPDKSTKNDVLLTYLPDVTFEEFRAKTAKGWNATWRLKDDVWILLRTAEQEQVEVDAFFASLAEGLLSEMLEWDDRTELTEVEAERLADHMARSEDGGGRFESLTSFEPGYGQGIDTLGRRALRRFLVKLGPRFLARLADWEYTVFESGGADHHHVALDEVMQTYDRETGRIRSAFAKLGQLEEFESSFDGLETKNVLRETLHASQGVAKLVVKIFGITAGLAATLYAFDEDGLLLFSDEDSLFNFGLTPSPSFPLDKPLDLTISDEAAAVLEFYVRPPNPLELDRDEDRPALKGSALMEVLKAMPDDDMLSYEISESLIALAKSMDIGLIARLSDEMQGGFALTRVRSEGANPDLRERTLDSSADGFAYGHHVELDSENRLLTIRPVTPAVLKEIYPRDAIAEFCRRADSASGANVYDLGRLFAAARDMFSLIGFDYLGQLVPEYEWTYQWTFEDIFVSQRIALLGWLNGAQHREARRPTGVTLRLSQLPGVIRDMPNLEMLETDFTYELLDSDVTEALGISRKPIIQNLIALAFPDGVPPHSPVNIRLVDSLYVYTEDSDKPRRSLEIFDMAPHYRGLASRDKTAANEWLATVPFYIGTVVEVTFRVDLGVALYQDFGEVVTSLGDGRAYRFHELPAQIQREFWKRVG